MKPSVDRKQAVRDYKARKIARGIYAVRAAGGADVWVGSSMNLDGAKNRLWFSLINGTHKDQVLQARWKALGDQAFEFEVLERLSDEISDLRIRDVLGERESHWTQLLHARSL